MTGRCEEERGNKVNHGKGGWRKGREVKNEWWREREREGGKRVNMEERGDEGQ